MEGKKNRMEEEKKDSGKKWKEIGCTSDSFSSYLSYVLSSYIMNLTDLFSKYHAYILKIIAFDTILLMNITDENCLLLYL